MKQSEAAKIVALLMACYPKAKVGDNTPMTYETMLADLDAEETMRAVRRIIATEDSPYALPTIAKIRMAVTGACVEGKSGELAWGDVLKAVSRTGIYGSPQFDDPLTEIAVSQVGWRDICNSDTRSLGFLRAAFVKSYNAAKDRIVVDGSANLLEAHVDRKRLAGLHDRAEECRGPILLGDVVSGVLGKAVGE